MIVSKICQRIVAICIAIIGLAGLPAHCSDKSQKVQKVQKLRDAARLHRKTFADDEAITLYTDALLLDPANAQVRMERAECYHHENRIQECIADYKNLLHSKKPSVVVNANLQLGKVYQVTKQFKEAIPCFIAARKMGIPYLLTELSDCSRAIGDHQAALKYSEQIILSGKVNDGRKHRALALEALGQPQEALLDYNYLVKNQTAIMARIDRESRAVYSECNHLIDYLARRAKCFEKLHKTVLAEQDRAAIGKIEREIFNESPFRTKEKHFSGN